MPKKKVGAQLKAEVIDAIGRVQKACEGAHAVILDAVGHELKNQTETELHLIIRNGKVRVVSPKVDYTFSES